MSVLDALTAAWQQGGGSVDVLEKEAWSLRYAVLVVTRHGEGTTRETSERLVHGALAQRGPGSPPLALIAAGAFASDGVSQVPEPLQLWQAPEVDGGVAAMVCLVPPG